MNYPLGLLQKHIYIQMIRQIKGETASINNTISILGLLTASRTI